MSIPRGYLYEFAVLFEAQAYISDLRNALKKQFPDWKADRDELDAVLNHLYAIEDRMRAHAADNPREEPKPIPGYPYISFGYELIANDSPATSSDEDPEGH